MKKVLVIVQSLLTIFFLTSCSQSGPLNERILRLGYMPNVTHSTPLVGIEKNIFQEKLGKNVVLKPTHFVVGNNIIDAFITNQIDIAYIGPGPFISAISRGIPLKLLDFACNAGTVIIGESITKDSKIAVPQFGNTQDLLLRMYLEEKRLLGDVSIVAIPSQDVATAFYTMSIHAACLPEPWGTVILDKANVGASGHLHLQILVDEKTILDEGNYPSTILVVNSEYLKSHPEAVKNFLLAHKEANDFILKNPDEAIQIVTKSISNIAKKEINPIIVEESFKRCSFNVHIDLNILKKLVVYGAKAGYYKKELLDELAASCYENSSN